MEAEAEARKVSMARSPDGAAEGGHLFWSLGTLDLV